MAWNNSQRTKISEYLRESEKVVQACHVCQGSGFIQVNADTMRHCDCKLNVAKQHGFLYRFTREGACYDKTFFEIPAYDGNEEKILWPGSEKE